MSTGIGYASSVTDSIGGGIYSPTFDKLALNINRKELKKNPFIELGMDNYNNFITANFDYGTQFAYMRNEILDEKGFATIERIVERDAQVIASLERLKLSVLQLGFKIKAKNDSPEAQELKAFWEYVFKEMGGTIEKALYELYGCIIYGYAISEMNWKFSNNPLFPGKIIIRDIKNKKPGVFQFETDVFGNIIGITNLYEPTNTLPKEKFLYLTWKDKYNNPYGCGLADTLYYLCWAKKQLLKQCLIGAAKWANPSLWIELTEDPSKEEIAYAKQFANDIQNSSAGVLPAPLKAHLLELANRHQNPCTEIINFLNGEIARCIALQEATSTSSQYGTYGAKEVEASSGIINERYLIEISQDLIYEKIIKPLTYINYNLEQYPIDLYPTIEFNIVEAEDKNKFVERVEKLTELGYINPSSKAVTDIVRSVDDYPEEVTPVIDPNIIPVTSVPQVPQEIQPQPNQFGMNVGGLAVNKPIGMIKPVVNHELRMGRAA